MSALISLVTGYDIRDRRIDITSKNIKSLKDYFKQKSCPNIVVGLECGYNLLRNLEGCPESITILNCCNNELESLKGLEGFKRLKSLTKLDCSYNQLVSLKDLEGLGLTKLDCSYNQLKSLKGLEGLKSLTELNCGNNQLIDLNWCPKRIRILNCSDNQLINLKGLECSKNIITLACGDNQLKSLEGLEDLKSLTKLACNDNQLENLFFLPAGVVTLYDYNNPLDEIYKDKTTEQIHKINRINKCLPSLRKVQLRWTNYYYGPNGPFVKKALQEFNER